jgi:hypothetical protein
MEDREKIAALTEFVKAKMEKYRQARDLQFKVNIALWTLIVLVGYRGEQILELSGLNSVWQKSNATTGKSTYSWLASVCTERLFSAQEQILPALFR